MVGVERGRVYLTPVYLTCVLWLEFEERDYGEELKRVRFLHFCISELANSQAAPDIPFQSHLSPPSQLSLRLPIIDHLRGGQESGLSGPSLSRPPFYSFLQKIVHTPQGKDGSSLVVLSGAFAWKHRNRVNSIHIRCSLPKAASPSTNHTSVQHISPRENHQRYRTRQPYPISSSHTEASSWSIRGRTVSRRRFR